MEENSKGNVSLALKIFIGLIVFLFLPVLLLAGLIYFLLGLFLSIMIWIIWGFQGRYILLVYSDSPIWKDVIENDVLPKILDKTIILNWSKRKHWKPSLAVWIFHFFGGRRNFNPMAIVFHPFRFNKIFRFYEAFQDYKHGKSEKFEKMMDEFLTYSKV